ncbi:S8 family peptidase [Spirosoma sordidisoli]|uniref:Serine protease n=1 Tax=Spirosoma sordidisoli TaxID=2502893 RepID=A0A4Q2UKF5_9BACT|nr:S8 family peptidase [Spirosoma sordidisoli]RYC68101.1 serine protease [Spirosoma sordidisoli]
MAKRSAPPSPSAPPAGNPVNADTGQVVVVFRTDSVPQPEAGTQAVVLADEGQSGALTSLLAAEGISLRPMFELSRSAPQPATNGLAETDELPNLSIYYVADVPKDRAEAVAESLRSLATVDGAYVQPEAALPFVITPTTSPADAAPPVTPNFTARQDYLRAAPTGIDADFAWTIPGGRGAGVQVIDIEGGWNFTHEDLIQNSGGLLSGVQRADWRDHGTAVLGEIGGDVNTLGITGISPEANTRAVSVYRNAAMAYNLPEALRQAADSLRPGDIILIEQQYGHPTRGWTTVEWWPAEFDAIRYAVARGVIVVEAAGNGGNNLDDAIYNTPLAGFPAGWRNPFNRANRDSGAVVVGAGNPPAGTHGRSGQPGEPYVDRARCGFSNFGAMVDVQGWGYEVTTTGYGDLQGGSENTFYTDQFSGTSSASPIVVGALASLQGILRTRGRIPLSPARAREVLRATGSPQQGATGRPATQRIGNRPNLRQLIPLVLQTNFWTGVQFTGTVGANATQRWFTFNWPAHWHVVWTVVPTSPRPGAPQTRLKVQVERSSDAFVTYWLNVTNLTNQPVTIEGRFAVLGW